MPIAFYEVGFITLDNGHAAFNREDPGKELAEHHDDEAGVEKKDAGPLPGELEAGGVRGQQISQQQGAERPAAGKRNTVVLGNIDGPKEKYLEGNERIPPTEVLLDDGPDAGVNLRPGAVENEDEGEHEEDHGDAQRGAELENLVKRTTRALLDGGCRRDGQWLLPGRNRYWSSGFDCRILHVHIP